MRSSDRSEVVQEFLLWQQLLRLISQAFEFTTVVHFISLQYKRVMLSCRDLGRPVEDTVYARRGLEREE